MTLEEAGVLLDALHAAFPKMEVSVETAQIYARFLVDVSLESGAEAVALWIATGAKFPTIAELRALAVTSGPPDADLAFAEVLRAVGAVGIYRTPSFSHPSIAQAVDAITWREVCLSEHAPSLRAHFAAAYGTARARAMKATHRELVAGIVTEVRATLVGHAYQRHLPPEASK